MQTPSLWKIFGIFTKIGAFTIGGGYAMIPVIESEMKERDWLRSDELDDLVVLAQSAPGLLAVNMAIFTGYRLRGLKGSVIATLGAVLPSFLIILAVAAFFTSFKENKVIASIFQGVRPVAVALILVPGARMLKNGSHSWWTWLITILTVFLIAFLKVSPIYILLVLIVGAVAVCSIKEKKNG